MRIKFEIQAFIRTEMIDMETNFWRVNWETKSTIIQRMKKKSIRETSNNRLKNSSHWRLGQTVFAPTNRKNKEELSGRRDWIKTDRRIEATLNLCLYHFLGPVIKPRKIHGRRRSAEADIIGDGGGGTGGAERWEESHPDPPFLLFLLFLIITFKNLSTPPP